MTVLPLLTSLILSLAVSSDPPPFQQGGDMRPQDEGSVRSIDNAIASYLDVQPQKGIVAPGDVNAWPLELKAGQVVIADSESEAIDPAIEVMDEKGAIVAKNDDRFPGDQRPLLFWRCPIEGKYSLRVRSFQNNQGGQCFTRFKVYDSFDIGAGQMAEKWVEESRRVLLRIPMKKGQIKQIRFETPDGWYFRPPLTKTISSLGLPNPGFSRPLDPAFADTIMAPVDGDYYVVAHVDIHQRRKIRAMAVEIPVNALSKNGAIQSAVVPAGTPQLWRVSAKAGDFVEVTTPELGIGVTNILVDEPDIAKFDLAKPETNPFFPLAPDAPRPPGPSFVELPARARDARIRVFAVRRDATLWLASNGESGNAKTYTMTVKPADRPFTIAAGLGSKLRIGNTDYWSFDAKVGDVMTFDFGAIGFAQKLLIRNPDFADVLRADAMPDQSNIPWNMIVSRPGRYLVAVSSLGDGGGGDYTLNRKVYPPKEFGKGSPAKGDFADGQTKVWKFTAKPDEPLYVHWQTEGGQGDISIRNDQGEPVSFGLIGIDRNNSYGILKVDKPTTYLIVLSPGDKAGKYSIELNDLPGYKKK